MNRLLILDFGSQFTQLIARRVRELGVYCEIFPADAKLETIKNFQANAIILSGGPHSVFDKSAPEADHKILDLNLPILGICYGMQWLAHNMAGKVESAQSREYGFMSINVKEADSPLFRDFKDRKVRTWMSHGDEVETLPAGFRKLAISDSGSLAAMENLERNIFALQFHPEVTHTQEGQKFFKNFLDIAGLKGDWDLGDFAEIKKQEIADSVGPSEHAICGLSGGVDSTVAATLVEQAIPGRLHCLYIDSGLQRENESPEVMASFKDTGLNVTMIDAKQEFLSELKNLTDPEAKRKTIGRVFIEVFERESKRIAAEQKQSEIKWMVQGTLYPDVIESVPPPGRGGHSSMIKSHHNVGGLPEEMNLKLIEPLRDLFKDEVRQLGAKIGVPKNILNRHPFPGPGLSIRCLGAITEERLSTLRAADKIFTDILRERNLYDEIWQAGVILLPISTVGVMGDFRTYESPAIIRAVTSMDGMTADWYPFEREVLAEISTKIINEVKGINRVAYDISTKPPATIEWE